MGKSKVKKRADVMELGQDVVADYIEVEKLALKKLKGSLDTDGSLEDAAAALKALNLVRSTRQTEICKQRSRFTMVRYFADDVGLKKYIKATFPQVRELTGDK